MSRIKFALTFIILVPLLASASGPKRYVVGPDGRGGYILPTLQSIHPSGTLITFPGRPVDLVLDDADRKLFVKEAHNLIVIDTSTNTVSQTLPYPNGDGASMHGICRSEDRIWITTAANSLLEAQVERSGEVKWTRTIHLPGRNGNGPADGCGIALCLDRSHLAVCLSIVNALAIVDIGAGKVDAVIPVGVAPYDVAVSPDGAVAYVSDWGGEQPKPGEPSAPSAGTQVRIDARGVASSGCVSVVDLKRKAEISRMATGLHPTGLILTADGTQLFVANANSDTISKIDVATGASAETMSVHGVAELPFGSAPNAVALSTDRRYIFAALGGNNAVAIMPCGPSTLKSEISVALESTGWYPGALAANRTTIYVASVKGVGSRAPGDTTSRWSVRQQMGCVNVIRLPLSNTMRNDTELAIADARLRAAANSERRSNARVAPVPVPRRTGELSVIKHIVYILKENRTYDQLFGDIKSGNGDPKLVMYGESVTPNHHALAGEFVLLDNYYCNGSLSADGHSWATEGNCTDHLEKSFGGFVRSYTFGDDPLTYSSSGFIWDKVLAAGLTFQNYGEMDYAEPIPESASFSDIYSDFKSGKHAIKFSHSVGIANLKSHTMPDYPGWNLKIPDAVRADIFTRDLQQTDKLAAFTLIYLPDDHTSGTSPGAPTPRAQVADNDLALGRIVDAISHSRFWPQTCIFVNEDDPQDGYDHVDGHRSLCLVISPYARRHATISAAYNQTSVLHTMERILGLTPMNQFDAESPLMDACFKSRKDLTAYTCLPNLIPLDEMNPPARKLSGLSRRYALKSAAMDWSKPDAADDETLNQVLWYSASATHSLRPEGARTPGQSDARFAPKDQPYDSPGRSPGL